MYSQDDDVIITKKITELVLEFFDPELIGGLGSVDDVFDADLTTKNNSYINSGYSYGNELEFIHFTSVKTLFSILNERSIRFYNLHNSNDPKEYSSLAHLLINNENEIAFRKKYIYTFSFCPMSMLKKSFVWNKYGLKYQGVALKFQIINDPKKWINFHISEIKYEQNEKIRNFSLRKKQIEKEFNVTFKVDLSRLLGFHKDMNWQNEEEVRMLTYFPYNKIEEYRKFSKVEYKMECNRNRFVEYLQLPLWVDDTSLHVIGSDLHIDNRLNLDENFFIEHPKIKIIDIYWGSKLKMNWQDLHALSSTINEMILYNFGYKVNISSLLINSSDHK